MKRLSILSALFITLLLAGCSSPSTTSDETIESTPIVAEYSELQTQILNKLDRGPESRQFIVDAYTVSYDYTEAEVEEAITGLDIDWNEQAVLRAEEIVGYSFHSRVSLIDKMQDFKFTRGEAEYAVDNMDVDWKEQAALGAQNLLESDVDYTLDQIANMLESRGFTEEEQEYGMESIK